MSKRVTVPVIAAALALGGAVAFAPCDAAAQQQQQGFDRPFGGDYQPRVYDRFPPEQGRPGDRMRGDPRWAAELDRMARQAFEHGFRQGQQDERRRRMAEQQRRGGGDRSGAGGDIDAYWVIPNVYPDTGPYRRMQDFVLAPVYTDSMNWLLTATQSLREAMQAMAQQEPSERRDRAMNQAREALLLTQQAMVQLPQEMRIR